MVGDDDCIMSEVTIEELSPIHNRDSGQHLRKRSYNTHSKNPIKNLDSQALEADPHLITSPAGYSNYGLSEESNRRQGAENQEVRATVKTLHTREGEEEKDQESGLIYRLIN
jgi:hypothetical protein